MWRIFATRRNAEIYALAVWLRRLRQRAAQGDGTLLNVLTRLKERVVDEWPDDDVSLRDALLAMTNQQLIDLGVRLNRLPWLGVDHQGVSTEVGQSNRWAEVRQTAAGTWAVPAAPWDASGVTEPAWPVTEMPS
jgi:hypothetical protein